MSEPGPETDRERLLDLASAYRWVAEQVRAEPLPHLIRRAAELDAMAAHYEHLAQTAAKPKGRRRARLPRSN